MISNIIAFVSSADEQTYSHGISWYREAHNYCQQIGDDTGHTLEEAAKTVAILSPGTSWELNKADALRMLQHHQKGRKTARTLKVSTYGKNKLKAWQYLAEELPYLEPKASGFKTYNFYRNILNPEDCQPVTIDRHAIRAAQGVIGSGSITLTKTVYFQAVEAYREAARQLSLIPCQAQAIAWCQYRLEAGLK